MMESHPLWLWIQQYGLWGVFGLMVLENMGVPFPTEPAFLYAVHQVRTGHLSFGSAFLVINLGHVVGSSLSYLLGLYSNNAVARWWQRSGKMQRARLTLERWYARHGTLALLLGRMVGYVRPFSSFIAGLGKVEGRRFWLWTSIGTLTINLLCWFAAEVLIYLWHRYPHLRWAVGGVFMVLTLGLVLYGLVHGSFHHWKKRRARREANGGS